MGFYKSKSKKEDLFFLLGNKESNMGVKGVVEGGIDSIIAGCSTDPLDLIKVRMQLQGESRASNSSVQVVRPGLTFQTITPGVKIHVPPPPPWMGPVAVGIRIVQQDGTAALFSGVSATLLRQTLFSKTRMGLELNLFSNYFDLY